MKIMKVANTRRVNDRINQLMTFRNVSHFLDITFNEPVSMHEIVFDSPIEVEDYATDFQNVMKSSGVLYTKDQAIIASMIMSVFDDSVDVQDIPSAILDTIIQYSYVFHKGEIESNPYYQNIHINHQKQGNFELVKEHYKKYELFMYDAPKDYFKGIQIPAVGTADYYLKFPCIQENGCTWMSITPNEIYTMKKPIEDATGNVLTLGCGMGYFAYMVALKDNVEHVTIIEKQPEVIELFNTFILPQFSCKDKITIVQADAFDYIKTLNDGEYDYCFVDIWQGNTDSVPYLKMKQLCNRFKKTTLSYWIEDAIVATMMGLVYSIIMEEVYKNQGKAIPYIPDLPDNTAYELAYLKELLYDVEITKPEHVDYYMDYHKIIELMNLQ